MKAEEVIVPKTVTIQIQLNDKEAEKQELVALVVHKDAEIEDLKSKQLRAKNEETKKGVEAQREQIAKQKSGVNSILKVK